MVSFLPKVILLNIEGIYQDFWENVSDVQRLLFTFFYPASVKMTEINHKYENTRKIHRLLTNQNPGFLYKV
jgi:hypothetical protein